ncbi:MAG: ABC transporter ATP-binding protein/permease [Actinobacteria bacterium]|nr:ABC transporter ATP-binding protein/permease [Actinomycetota bacterium]
MDPVRRARGVLLPVLRVMATRHPLLFAICCLILLLTGVLPVAFTLASGALVGSVPGAVEGGFGSPAGQRLVLVLGVTVGIFVLQQGVGAVGSTLAYGLGERLTGHLKRRVMRVVLSPPGVAHLEDPAVLSQVASAQAVGTGQYTPRHAVMGIMAVWSPRLSAVGSAILLATFRWWLAVVLLAAWTGLYLTIYETFKKQIASMMNESDILRRANYIAELGLTSPAAKETRIFGLSAWLGTRYVTDWVKVIAPLMAERKKGRWKLPLVCIGLGFLITFGFVIVGRAALSGELTLGQLMVYLGAVGGVGAIASLSGQHLEMGWGLASAQQVFELERDLGAAAHSRFTGETPAEGLPRDEICFEDVSFAYPSGATVFDGLDLRIQAGRSLAVVGDNGAGKTTLVKLLARLYDPTSGRITVDGKDIAELRPDEWQRRVAAIFQDFVRYELSASDNVVLGAVEYAGDRSARDLAARRAGALEIIEGLESAWDTPLSRQAKEGTDLSGGQWQRVALARALFAVQAGAGVLVLDEPTANLDVRAEADLYDRFLDLTKGVTTVVISHRFSTVRRADRIVVLDGGKVTEDGTHDELMAAGGRYATMFRLQAARFVDAPQPDSVVPAP